MALRIPAKRLLRLFAAALAALALAVAAGNAWVVWPTKDRVFANAAEVPSGGVGLVLGAMPEEGFVGWRVEAAGELWKAGKVKSFVVSGDGSERGGGQMEFMRAGLVRLGVPESAIAVDPAGFRTLDSVARFEGFASGLPVVVVSQKFHAYRSLYLADHFHLKATAYCARQSDSVWDAGIAQVREVLARVKALLDLHLLNTSAREPLPAP